MPALSSYELSLPADRDLDDILDCTSFKFGIDQAIKYLEGLDDLLSELLINPELGRVRDEVKPGLRSISYLSHTIFYRILRDKLRVVRVLHGSQDVVRQFKISND